MPPSMMVLMTARTALMTMFSVIRCTVLFLITTVITSTIFPLRFQLNFTSIKRPHEFVCFSPESRFPADVKDPNLYIVVTEIYGCIISEMNIHDMRMPVLQNSIIQGFIEFRALCEYEFYVRLNI